MQAHNLFEYAIIRIVPRVEREEFLNVGVILYSRPAKFLEARYTLNRDRLLSFNSGLDLDELEDICRAWKEFAKAVLMQARLDN